MKPVTKGEPRTIKDRLESQIEMLLDDLESGNWDITVPQRISALIAIGRICVIFKSLSKADEAQNAGSAVRKYSKAFAANASRGGAARSRPTLVPADPERDLDPGTWEDGEPA